MPALLRLHGAPPWLSPSPPQLAFLHSGESPPAPAAAHHEGPQPQNGVLQEAKAQAGTGSSQAAKGKKEKRKRGVGAEGGGKAGAEREEATVMDVVEERGREAEGGGERDGEGEGSQLQGDASMLFAPSWMKAVAVGMCVRGVVREETTEGVRLSLQEEGLRGVPAWVPARHGEDGREGGGSVAISVHKEVQGKKGGGVPEGCILAVRIDKTSI